MGKGPRVDTTGDIVYTQQSGKDDADINVIVERAKRGVPVQTRDESAMYGDFTQVPTDLRDCLNKMRFADQLFMSMDANVRKRFNNQPVEMLDFLSDPKNRDEAIKLGLVVPPAAAPVDPVEEQLKGLRQDLKESSGAKKSKPKGVDE